MRLLSAIPLPAIKFYSPGQVNAVSQLKDKRLIRVLQTKQLERTSVIGQREAHERHRCGLTREQGISYL
jgi:hypothetical protein